MPKADNREDYVKSWNSHVDWCLNGLMSTLPRTAMEQFKSVKNQALALVQLAADEGFPGPNGEPKPSCNSCLHTGQSYDKCFEGCLDKDEDGQNLYKDYVHGDAVAEILKQERSGERNIVIGGSGEMEVNVLWPLEEARKKLFDVGCDVGGFVDTRQVGNGYNVTVTKSFDPYAYVLEYLPKSGLYQLGRGAEQGYFLSRIVAKRTHEKVQFTHE